MVATVGHRLTALIEIRGWTRGSSQLVLMGIVRPSLSPTWHAMETDSKAKAHRKRQSGPKAEKKKKKKSTEEGSNPKAFTNKWVLAHSQPQDLPPSLMDVAHIYICTDTCTSYNNWIKWHIRHWMSKLTRTPPPIIYIRYRICHLILINLYTVIPRFKAALYVLQEYICTQNKLIIMVFVNYMLHI